jgi:CelD/BcsL family acetyltransferase involved in cellulose biosynthesis
MTTDTQYPESSLEPSLQTLQADPANTLVIETLADFQAIGAEWDHFILEVGIHSLSMMHHWLTAWLEHFLQGERLCTIIIRDTEGRWLAAAPFQITHGRSGYSHRLLRFVQFIGTQPTVFDWMEIAMHPQADEQQVLTSIANVLNQKQRHWDAVDLYFCPHQSHLESLARLMKPKMSEKTLAVSLRETMPIPWLALPDNEEQYLEKRSKKMRLKINRHRNTMRKETGHDAVLAFKPTTSAEFPETQKLLDIFVEGHIDYWKQRNVKSEFSRFSQLPLFYRDVLKQAEPLLQAGLPAMRFSTLELDGKPMSYQLGFWQGNGYLFHMTHYNHEFERYSPGTLHTESIIVDTIQRHGLSFSFGRGDEPYKRLWTKTTQPLWSLRFFKTPWSQCIWEIDAQLKHFSGRAVL